jgi:YaiO family outer membrane protein
VTAIIVGRKALEYGFLVRWLGRVCRAAPLAVLFGRLFLPSVMGAQQNDGPPASPPPSLVAVSETATAANTAAPSNVQPLDPAAAGSAPASRSKPPLSGSLEFGAGYSAMSAGYNAGDQTYLHADIEQSSKTEWSGDAVRAQDFGDTGYLLVVGVNHDFTGSFYGDLHIGGSSGGFFLPAFTVEGSLHKKWLSQKQLFTSFGMGYDRAKDEHRDTRLLASANYYFGRPWMIESGMTFNLSAPGTVFSHSQYLAVRQGRNNKYFVTLRGEFGNEAYQITGVNTSISDFRSRSVSLTWRQWVRAGWGFNLGGQYYSNPYFQRKGGQLGIFKHF